MARKKSISSIEAEISKVKEGIDKTQAKYEILSARLLALQKQQRECQADLIMDAYAKSGKSYRELMTFLGV